MKQLWWDGEAAVTDHSSSEPEPGDYRTTYNLQVFEICSRTSVHIYIDLYSGKKQKLENVHILYYDKD